MERRQICSRVEIEKKRSYESLAKIYDDYIKICDELDLPGGFAVLYPELLTNIIKVIPDLNKADDRAKKLSIFNRFQHKLF